ncbi:oxysterol-binding protein-like protein [Phanerochaete sordida]|uniref:Oxysterol-binding protein-like protein n=1 Tax=Phanerochaete sordida TaxID=48140 RepID=A0A9P3LAC0_9APHY|nr:oxysterol-binding protein-like protein [Phanerochaete sordida]
MSTAHDEVDTSEPPVSVPDTGDAGESGKLKMIVSLVKKCFGVKDIASMRLSLPASLLEPIPNLEYWHYLDRPDLFSAINDSDDAFERMMAVLRFTFSKDLKFIHGKVCKPYNSVIGEHFRAHWDVLPVSYPEGNRLQMPVQHLYLAPAAAESVYSTADSSSVKSGVSAASGLSRKPGSQKSTNGRLSTSTVASGTGTPTISTPATSAIEEIDAELEKLNLDPNAAQKLLPPSEREKLKGLPGNVSMSSVHLVEEDSPVMSPVLNGEPSRLRTLYLTEQISHHPPVSAFHASCPSRHLTMCGIDQISAKVSGTTVRVAPGQYNKGIYVHVEDRLSEDGKPERYHITHPPAHVNGILRGSFYITVSESTYVTCTDGPAWVVPGGKDKGKRVGLRAVVDYKEESWIGKANFLLDAVVHTYDLDDPAAADAWTKVKHVPRERVVATLAGSWRHMIKYKLNPAFFPTRTGSTLSLPADEWVPLIDLSMLYPIPKLVRDVEKQEEKESRRMWQNVTDRLLRKEYSEANKYKQAIEQRQREEEAARKQSGEKYVPRYFVWDVETGLPTLTEDGKRALEEEMKEQSAHPLVQ